MVRSNYYRQGFSVAGSDPPVLRCLISLRPYQLAAARGKPTTDTLHLQIYLRGWGRLYVTTFEIAPSRLTASLHNTYEAFLRACGINLMLTSSTRCTILTAKRLKTAAVSRFHRAFLLFLFQFFLDGPAGNAGRPGSSPFPPIPPRSGMPAMPATRFIILPFKPPPKPPPPNNPEPESWRII